jgi:hypothetical protein
MPRRAATCLLLLALAPLVAVQPCGLLPGGRLQGEPASNPEDDWSFLDAEERCQIELRPADPYSVIVNCHQSGGRLYAHSLIGGRKRWTRLALENPNVRVRLRGRVYELVATRIDDAAERRRVLSPGGGEPPDGTWLFRLAPRPGVDQAPRSGSPAAR